MTEDAALYTGAAELEAAYRALRRHDWGMRAAIYARMEASSSDHEWRKYQKVVRAAADFVAAVNEMREHVAAQGGA